MKNDFWHRDFTWDGHSFNSREKIRGFVQQNYPELEVFIGEWFGETGEISMRTSGSTGTPKKIRLHRTHMISSARATADFFGLNNGARALLCLPLEFIAGRMMLIRSMVMGWKLEVIRPASKPEIPIGVTYDFAAMVPMQVYNSLDRLGSVRTLIVGGGQISASLLKRIAALETKIYATYGMTETITHVGVCPVNKAAGKIGENVVYRALPGITFSQDKRQCLVIEAPSISNEKVVTNDIVELHSNCSFTWISRFDHVINSGGIKLIPELIEAKFRSMIREPFFFWGLPDKKLGQKLILLIETDRPYEVMDKLSSYQKSKPERISKFEMPREIFFVKEFSRTGTGKIRRALTVSKQIN